MKNNHFFISDEGYTRAKKQLKKHLKNEGVDFSLSQCANLLAKSFGFNDEHHIQQKINIVNDHEKDFIKHSKRLKDFNLSYDMDINIFDTKLENIGDKKSNSSEMFPVTFDLNSVEKMISDAKECRKNDEIHKHVKAIQDIWKDAFYYLSNNTLQIAQKAISELSKEESLHILKSIEKVKATHIFWENNQDKIISGSENIGEYLSNKNIIGTNMAMMRHTMSSIFRLTHDEKYRDLAIKMDDCHNIEQYFYLPQNERDGFYLQPENFNEESCYDAQRYFTIKKDELPGDIEKDIVILGESNTGRDALAVALRHYMKNFQRKDLQIIKVLSDFSLLFDKDEEKGQCIYIVEAENIEVIKSKAKAKAISGNDSLEQFSLFLKTNVSYNDKRYQIIDVK